MNKAEFEAIKKRSDDLATAKDHDDDPPMALVCMRGHECVDPIEFGFDVAERFKKRCESFANAAADRAALLRFIEDGFDVAWDEDAPNNSGKG